MRRVEYSGRLKTNLAFVFVYCFPFISSFRETKTKKVARHNKKRRRYSPTKKERRTRTTNTEKWKEKKRGALKKKAREFS
jgi:hypothetical protein